MPEGEGTDGVGIMGYKQTGVAEVVLCHSLTNSLSHDIITEKLLELVT